MLEKMLLSVLCVLALYQLKRFLTFITELQYKRRLVKNMPGPESRYFVGSMHLLPKELAGFPEFFIRESRKVLEQGRSVMRIWFGSRLIVFPLDGESAKVIWNSTVELNKGHSYGFMRRWLGNGLVTGENEYWYKSRRLLTPVFHFAKLDEYSCTMNYHCRRLINYLRPSADGHSTTNLYDPIKRATLDIIADAAMGIEFNSLMDEKQPYSQAMIKFARLSFLHVNYYQKSFEWLWWLMGYEREAKAVLRVLQGTSEWVIRERMLILESQGECSMDKKKLNFLDLLLNLHLKKELTLQEVREQVDTFLFAGHDTTSHGISWTIWCLATHPEIQERVYKELVEAFGSDCEDLEWKKMQELAYLKAVIKETIRLFSPVPMVERQLKNEIEIDGFTIPRNTSVKIPIFLLHRNYKTFPEPYRFNPDNFYLDKQFPASAYVPFAAGPRNCIGQRFAQRELITMVSHLVYEFRISTDKKLEDNGMELNIVLRPTLGVPVTLTPRRK